MSMRLENKQTHSCHHETFGYFDTFMWAALVCGPGRQSDFRETTFHMISASVYNFVNIQCKVDSKTNLCK